MAEKLKYLDQAGSHPGTDDTTPAQKCFIAGKLQMMPKLKEQIHFHESVLW